MNNLLEICCGSYYDALQAHYAQAKRIELNSALHLGGLTPSLASLLKTKETTQLDVICMVRPRGGGFCYVQEDIETMFLDAKILLENGADGIAFGFLNNDKTIDKKHTSKMVQLIHDYGKEAVFHRAIDVCNNMEESVQDVIACGCDRILTSGGCDKAIYGRDILKTLYTHYHNQIQFIIGSGIDASNASHIMEYTGIKQLHSSCKTWLEDPTSSNRSVSYSYAKENRYDVVSQEKVEDLLKSMQENK